MERQNIDNLLIFMGIVILLLCCATSVSAQWEEHLIAYDFGALNHNKLAKLDNNRKLDVVVGWGDEYSLAVYWNIDSTMTMTGQNMFDGPYNLTISDLNNDGINEYLYTKAIYGDYIGLYWNNSLIYDGYYWIDDLITFWDQVEVSNVLMVSTSFSLYKTYCPSWNITELFYYYPIGYNYVMDFDGDGNKDFLFHHTDENANKIPDVACMGIVRDFTFHEITYTESYYYPVSIVPVDMDGDGDMDFAANYMSGISRLCWVENVGDFQMVIHDMPPGFRYGSFQCAVDLIGDNVPELVYLESETSHLNFMEIDRSGEELSFFIHESDYEVISVEDFGDIDGDGDIDLLAGKSNGPNRYLYWYENQWMETVVESSSVEAPSSSALISVYPNPFNDRTSIVVELHQQGDLAFSLHDLLGRRVMYQSMGDFRPGEHRVDVSFPGIASGMYLLTVHMPGIQESRRITLIR